MKLYLFSRISRSFEFQLFIHIIRNAVLEFAYKLIDKRVRTLQVITAQKLID